MGPDGIIPGTPRGSRGMAPFCARSRMSRACACAQASRWSGGMCAGMRIGPWPPRRSGC